MNPPDPTDDLRRQIGKGHGDNSEPYLKLARWSAGAVVATWAFRDLGSHPDGHGLFSSLNQNARDTLACLSLVPLFLPLVTMAFSLYMTYGSFYVSARRVLAPADNPYRVDLDRGIVINLLLRGMGRGWRWWLGTGWWIAAVAAGGATVALSGALLRGSQSGWLVWVLVAGGVYLILKIESLLTRRRYEIRTADDLPSPEQAQRRMVEWRAMRRYDTSGMPWIYGYSGLTSDEIRTEFTMLGLSGAVGFTSRIFQAVVVVIVYSALPAPSVARFHTDGLIGCLFVNLHGFAGVAEENLGVYMGAALVLLLLLPVFVLLAYLRFMLRHRFPREAIAQVLVRETPFAFIMPGLSVLTLGLGGIAIALALWASAAIANWWDSSLAGALVLVVPLAVVAIRMNRRDRRRRSRV
jgi:hypothetical protein